VLSDKLFWCYNYCNAGHGGRIVEGMWFVNHFNTGIVCSYYTWAMDVCCSLFIVHVQFHWYCLV